MTISNEVIEAARGAEQVFLPNRYQEPFVDAFQVLTGEEVPEMQGRKLTVRSNGRTYRWVRGRNIPEILGTLSKVRPDLRSVGLTGSEWCVEYDAGWSEFNMPVCWDRLTEKNLGKLALVAPSSSKLREQFNSQEPNCYKVLEVVTTFPDTVRKIDRAGPFILSPAFDAAGCVEGVADALDMAAVDLVSSGNTLKENDFTVLQELIEVYPALVWAEKTG